MDTSIQSQLMNIGDLAEVQAAGYAKRGNYSTAEELWQSGTDRTVKNRASEQSDAGREPYLVSRDAIEFGVHPFVEIHDVMIEKKDGLIGLERLHGTKWVAPETLIVWM